MGVKNDNVKWVDGLRGVASFLVVLTHLARITDEELFFPSDSAESSPRILQWPLIRVLFQGRIGVGVFAMVTGYVCALKPIRQAKAGNIDGALMSIAKSAFRRIPRLVLPTTIITLILWVACQLGAFQVARHSDNRWLAATAPEVLPNMSVAVRALGNSLITTWTQGLNVFDPNQWTLQPLLRSSMLVYVTVCATIHMQPRYRMFVSLVLWGYFYFAGDSAFGMSFSFGLFLADFQNRHPINSPPGRPHWLLSTVLSPFLIVIGLFLASYPEDHADWTSWSKLLKIAAAHVVPPGQYEARYFTVFGLQLICFGIHFSPRLKDILSNHFLLYLGKNSFAIYLIHGLLMRSVLSWMLYGTQLPAMALNEQNELVPGPALKFIVGRGLMAVFITIWLGLLYGAAHLWTTLVDPMCAKWTAMLERYVELEGEAYDRLLLK